MTIIETRVNGSGADLEPGTDWPNASEHLQIRMLPSDRDDRCSEYLATLPTRRDKIEYAVRVLPPGTKPAAIREWLNSHGQDFPASTRTYVSTTAKAFRDANGLEQAADTDSHPTLVADVQKLIDAEPPADPQPASEPPAAELAGPEESPQPAAAPSPGQQKSQGKKERKEKKEGKPSGAARAGRVARTVIGTTLLDIIIVTPLALSSQDIIKWAESDTGLGLDHFWAVSTFIALDAAAAFCVCVTVYCVWKDDSAGIFGWLVWVFAGASAFANYRHTSGGVAQDAVWFLPFMSLIGPFLLEAFLRRVRKWLQEDKNRRARHGVAFGPARWLPFVGATRESYGAWRLARLDGIDDADQAIAEFRALSPSGTVSVVELLRKETADQRAQRKQAGIRLHEQRVDYARQIAELNKK